MTTAEDQAKIDATPFDETEINYQEWLNDADASLNDKTRDELKRTIVGLARRLSYRYQEGRRLNQEATAWRDIANTQREVVKELKARSLATLQQRVHDWRKAAYPDTRGIELQALGVAEESGELCHAVLKFKQGIRGYDFNKTHDEVGDAIGDIIIYAMGVADTLDISVEEALYKTVEHVINRNITQGSDAGEQQAKIDSLSVRKFVKGDRVRVINGGLWDNRLGTVHPVPGIDPHHPRGQVMVMIDGKDSPWSFDPEDLLKVMSIEQAAAEDVGQYTERPDDAGCEAHGEVDGPCDAPPKGVDWAGHVPADHEPSDCGGDPDCANHVPQGPSGVGCFPPVTDSEG